ncbi:MAG: GGDEF domain-containing protein [Pseudomonadota bacterium]|nr:GGDEF domain-containing protein [Pseudomonadota bacterium]
MKPAAQTSKQDSPPAPPGLLPARTIAQQQRLRLRRFGMASSTYFLGLVVLGLCTLLGLFPRSALLAVGALFLATNAGLLLAFTTRWNERFADPSLTGPQVYLAVILVPLILVLGRDVHFVAAPYYSSIFVFAMLQMRARDLVRVAAFVLVSYGVALLLRHQLYGSGLDWRVEAVTAMLVVAGSVWFATAASYISNLRGRLRGSLQHIATLATYDDLTGLWNRRQIDQMLEAAVKHAQRHGSALCVAMMDVDHFKRINDRYGHAMGDEVLKAVAGTLAGSVRAGDEVGRFGGEEFVLLLPATTMAQATSLADRLRSRMETLQSTPAGEPPVTGSFGLAAWRAGESAGDLVRRADQALYRAKAGGRNRVEADSLFGALVRC